VHAEGRCPGAAPQLALLLPTKGPGGACGVHLALERERKDAGAALVGPSLCQTFGVGRGWWKGYRAGELGADSLAVQAADAGVTGVRGPVGAGRAGRGALGGAVAPAPLQVHPRLRGGGGAPGLVPVLGSA